MFQNVQHAPLNALNIFLGFSRDAKPKVGLTGKSHISKRSVFSAEPFRYFLQFSGETKPKVGLTGKSHASKRSACSAEPFKYFFVFFRGENLKSLA